MRSFILGVASGVIASAMIVGVIAIWADHLDYASSAPTLRDVGYAAPIEMDAQPRQVWTGIAALVPSRPLVVCDSFSKEALDQLRDIAK